MYCGNCGAENSNNARFCKNCGSPLGAAPAPAPKPTPGPVPKAERKTVSAPEPDHGYESGSSFGKSPLPTGRPAGKKSLPMAVIIGAVVAVLAVIAILVLVITGSKEVKMDKYIQIKTEGYNGYGKAYTVIDWDGIQRDYGPKLTYTKQAVQQYGALLKATTPIDTLKDSISVSLDKTTGLSNGDELTYTWSVDPQVGQLLKCKVKYTDGSVSVKDLEEVATFDAFQELSVSFSGVAPDGSVDLYYSGSDLEGSDFYCQEYGGYSNGDTVTVYIKEDQIDYLAESLGRVPESLSKEYTVNGLEKYVTALSEVKDDQLKDAKKQAEDVYNAYVAKEWDEGSTFKSMSYLGSYLLTPKNEGSWNKNEFYMIYKIRMKNYYSNDGASYNKTNTSYWYISFRDIMTAEDGSLTIDLTSYDVPYTNCTIDSGVSSGWFSTKSWSYRGYNTLADLYREVVASNTDSFNHEENVKEDSGVEDDSDNASEADKGNKDNSGDYADVKTSDGYVLPDSDKVLVTEADLDKLTKEECRIARNEIYARHGRKFDTPEMKAYFNSCEWYKGTVEINDFDESVFNDIESKNKDFIDAYEKKKGYK